MSKSQKISPYGIVALGGAVVLGTYALWGARRPPGAAGSWSGPTIEVPKVHAPLYVDNHASRVAFVRDTVGTLMLLGLSLPSALLFTTHLARETGLGRYLFDNNFGNIKAYNPLHGPYYVLTDSLGFTDRYRAYSSAVDGLGDAVHFISTQTRYARAWQLLLAGDPNWYGALGLAGYYEGPPDPARPGVHTSHNATTIVPVQNEYNSLLRTVQGFYNESGGVPAASFGVGTLAAVGLAAVAAYAVYRGTRR